jgi:hypothetical protein
MTLKYENTAQVGDVIRAYDFEPFPGRRDRYVEGIVLCKTIKYGAAVYIICGMVDTMCDDDSDSTRVGDHISVPFETIMDYDGRVTLIEEVVF